MPYPEVFPQTAEVKALLTSMKANAPSISSLKEQKVDLTIWTRGREYDHDTMFGAIFGKHPVLRAMTDYLIGYANLHAEDSPLALGSVTGYIGTNTGEQLVAYTHTDGTIPMRFNINVADTDCTTNPSTKVFPDAEYDGRLFISQLPVASRRVPSNQIPEDIEWSRAPEGGISAFHGRQIHAETDISVGTTKLLLVASMAKSA